LEVSLHVLLLSLSHRKIPMIDVRLACPRCSKRLKTMEPPAVGQRFQCPRCNHPFTVRADDLRPATCSDVLVAQPFAPPPLAVPAPRGPGGAGISPAPACTRDACTTGAPAAAAEPFPEPVGTGKALLTVTA